VWSLGVLKTDPTECSDAKKSFNPFSTFSIMTIYIIIVSFTYAHCFFHVDETLYLIVFDTIRTLMNPGLPHSSKDETKEVICNRIELSFSLEITV
jgi:hypothetical protein